MNLSSLRDAGVRSAARPRPALKRASGGRGGRRLLAGAERNPRRTRRRAALSTVVRGTAPPSASTAPARSRRVAHLVVAGLVAQPRRDGQIAGRQARRQPSRTPIMNSRSNTSSGWSRPSCGNSTPSGRRLPRPWMPAGASTVSSVAISEDRAACSTGRESRREAQPSAPREQCVPGAARRRVQERRDLRGNPPQLRHGTRWRQGHGREQRKRRAGENR